MPADIELGQLERVELREIWATEGQDFTPWLAQEENIRILGDAIGVELEVEAQEQAVGPFRADILCRNVDNGTWVLIENQLERTDHIHLGQLLTYAAGLHAVTIVWVAARISDEHRAALDWLNEITDERFRFFGLEVELWRIGASPAAPKFSVVSKANDWSRNVTSAAGRIAETATTDTQATYLEFWRDFARRMTEGGSSVRPQAPAPQHWMNFGVGRGGFMLGSILNSRENKIGVELVMNDQNAKPYFHLLHENREAIENELGFEMDWRELPEKISSKLRYLRSECDPLDRDRWGEYIEWMREHLETMNDVFRPKIRALNADEWESE